MCVNLSSYGPPHHPPAEAAESFYSEVKEKEGMTIMEVQTHKILEELSVGLRSKNGES